MNERNSRDGDERGYRGDSPPDTPPATTPGSVPGGSYGGGGGYRQGGYDRGDYDPAVEGYRMDRGRGRPDAERGGWSRSRHEPQSGARDWRQGYGAYGPGERRQARTEGTRTEGMRSEGMRAGDSMFGSHAYEDEPANGYGFGSRGGAVEGSEGGWGRPSGRPGEQQWNPSMQGGRSRDQSVPWPYMEPWAVPGPFTGRGPEGWERPNEAIRHDVCERLTRHGELDASRIRVSVEKGEVTLEGRVDSRSAKRMAEDTAESVIGVRDIQNRLRIDHSEGA